MRSAAISCYCNEHDGNESLFVCYTTAATNSNLHLSLANEFSDFLSRHFASQINLIHIPKNVPYHRHLYNSGKRAKNRNNLFKISSDILKTFQVNAVFSPRYQQLI